MDTPSTIPNGCAALWDASHPAVDTQVVMAKAAAAVRPDKAQAVRLPSGEVIVLTAA